MVVFQLTSTKRKFSKLSVGAAQMGLEGHGLKTPDITEQSQPVKIPDLYNT